jgi:hypothetical protein
VPRVRTPEDKLGLEVIAYSLAPTTPCRRAHTAEIFRFSFFVPREMGRTADFSLCFGRTESETAGH